MMQYAMYMQYWQMMQQQQQQQQQVGLYAPQTIPTQEPVAQAVPPPQPAGPSLLPSPAAPSLTPPSSATTSESVPSGPQTTPAPTPAEVDRSLTDMSLPRNVETLNAQFWEELNAENYATQQVRLP